MKNALSVYWHKLASVHRIETLAQRYAGWCYALAGVLLALGWGWGLFIAPADYQQSDAFRIIYVHVPVAFLSMAIYVSMALASIAFYVWNIRLGAYYCRAVALLGCCFTALALITGAIWGKPMWGTYWSWQDPRLLSELLLLFLYLGYMALIAAIPNTALADKIGAILLTIGVINIPIIHYSVVWWTSLHQGATLLKWGKPSMTVDMLIPLCISLVGMVLFTAGYALTAIRTLSLSERNQRAKLKRLGVICG